MNTLNGLFIDLVLAVFSALAVLAALLALAALLGVLSRVLLGLLSTSHCASASTAAATAYRGKVVSAGVSFDFFSVFRHYTVRIQNITRRPF
jgi:hypothetical protein